MKTQKTILCVTLVLLFIIAGPAMATTITNNMAVDDAFNLYLSTDDSQIGTLIGSGSAWGLTYTFTRTLTQGVTNYIHVVGTDVDRVIAAFLGDFSVSDNSFEFANGTQSLVTDSAHWSISDVGFGQSPYTPDEIGTNGVAPWGFSHPGISASAFWIWSDNGQYSDTPRYFSTPITPVPEPTTIALLGFGALSLLRRKAT